MNLAIHIYSMRATKRRPLCFQYRTVIQAEFAIAFQIIIGPLRVCKSCYPLSIGLLLFVYLAVDGRWPEKQQPLGSRRLSKDAL
jgi:hypothetical protein